MWVCAVEKYSVQTAVPAARRARQENEGYGVPIVGIQLRRLVSARLMQDHPQPANNGATTILHSSTREMY